MKTVIFSGTTEGRDLSRILAAEGADVVVSVASEVGAEEQGSMEGITVSEGLKDEDGIRQLIRGADLVVDATHPYAVLVTENIRKAAEAENIERLRLVRDRTQRSDIEDTETTAEGFRILMAADAGDAAGLALEEAGEDGRVLLTTGSKELPVYAETIDPERLIPRVLPVVSSIESCERAGIPHRNIVAVQGPFSTELNLAVLHDYDIAVMVTKESGSAGGFAEKIQSCRMAGIPAVIIARPEDSGLSFEEVLKVCRERIK